MTNDCPTTLDGCGPSVFSPAVTHLCLPHLLKNQNHDGGWAYTPGLVSRTEPTAWVVCALAKHGGDESQRAARGGRLWLSKAQGTDGWWTPHPGMQEGSWVSAAACLALVNDLENSQAVAQGAQALTRLQPKKYGIWQKLVSLIRHKGAINQDFSLYGWSWIPGTVSWVIPTAMTLIFFRNLPQEQWPRGAAERIAVGEAMLLDRICPGGGWNIGNPMVYGAAGIPLVEPTAWALLALQNESSRPQVREGVAWLEGAVKKGDAAGALGVAGVALEVHGRPMADLDDSVAKRWASNQFLHNSAAVALSALALLPGPDVLRWRSSGTMK